MPITTPQGTLDFKKVDRVTFVGASSNTVIDTTTGSLGVGVDGNGPTSKLHVVGNTRLEGDINMLHTSNTASIKLNSNVVAEFPRSKKLIKYPRVALTANDNSGTSGYVADQTNTASHGNADAYAYRLFDNTSGGYQSGTAYSSGNPTASAPTTTASDGSTHQGVAITLDLVTKIRLDHVVITSHANYGRTPVDGTFLGSHNSSTWDVIGTFTGLSTFADNQKHTITITNSSQKLAYRYIRFVVTKTHTSPVFNAGSLLEFRELQYFGVPEYDPDAHGTDVTIKSYPNVPNTDWLEVYYDAKNYTSGVVQDETTNDRDGVLYGDTSLTSADGIHKFDFDGNGDYIKTTLTGFTGTTVTFSAWVFMDSVAAGRANTIMGLGNWGSTGSAAWIAVGTNGVLETGSISIGSCASSVQASTLTKQWLHITGIVSSGDFRLYQDGQLIKSLNTTGTINYGANPVLYLATRADPSGNPESTRYIDCKIANARLFNRALTSDEIYQLYAYQKEYFGHSTNNMTLKAGRLGIGTSEPRGALDVRGDAYYGCPVFFTAYAGNGSNATSGSSSAASGGTVIIFSNTTVNKGGAYDTSNGRCTFPISGYYEVFFRGGTASSTAFHARIYRNGSVPGSGGWTNHVMRVYDNSGGTYRNGGTIHFFYYFTAGEYIDVRMTEGTFNADNYNSFSVKYLSN